MIDFMRMAESMKSHGFQNIRLDAEYGGVPFRLVAEARAGLVKQTILISSVSTLDKNEALRIGEEFLRIDGTSRGVWVGKIFTYCLFAEKVDRDAATELAERIRKNDLKASNFVKGGGGAILIFDISTRGFAGGYYPRFVGINILADVIGETMASSDSSTHG